MGFMRRKNLDVEYVKVKCECGHVIPFLSNKRSSTCRHCGRLVYPSKKCEFKEKLNRQLRRSIVNE